MFYDVLGEETEALELISGRICCVGLTENLIKAVKAVRKKLGKGTEEDSEGVYGFSSSVHKVRAPVN